MAGKWIQPFPSSSDLSELRLDNTAEQAWLDLEIVSKGQSIARFRKADLKLGHRLEVQLKMAQAMAGLLAPRFNGQHLRIQLHDEDPGISCLRMDAPLNADLDDSPLIPDPYCLGTNGYEGYRKQLQKNPLPSWRDRLPIIFWRGSTTGSKNITPSNLAENLRYQLCYHSLDMPAYLDARFNRVVQALDEKNQVGVEKLLRKINLMGTYVDPWHASLHAWLIDIDGNVNSWGLLWKLLSGCCVLRVQSNRQQWFHPKIVPWEHIVPIAPDLSDLREKIDWCLKNHKHCEAIAAAGEEIGKQIVADINLDLCTATVRYAQRWFDK